MRTKREVDMTGLRAEIARQEATNVFTGRSQLCQAVAASEWGQAQPGLSASVVLLRIQEYNIPIKTAVGKRGRGKALAASRQNGTVVRRPRSEKMKAFAPTMNHLKEEWGETSPTRVEAAQKGSLKALIALKCMECTGGQRTEIKGCSVFKCPLFPVRPFQGGVVEEVEVVQIGEKKVA